MHGPSPRPFGTQAAADDRKGEEALDVVLHLGRGEHYAHHLHVIQRNLSIYTVRDADHLASF